MYCVKLAKQMKRNSVTQLRRDFNKCRYFVVNICNPRAWSVTGSQFDIYSRIKYLDIPSKTPDLDRFGVKTTNIVETSQLLLLILHRHPRHYWGEREKFSLCLNTETLTSDYPVILAKTEGNGDVIWVSDPEAGLVRGWPDSWQLCSDQ